MKFNRPSVAGVVGVAMWGGGVSLAALSALAQEVEPPAPWVKLTGSHAGAVGTCSAVDATDNEACYMVRCDAKSGLVFEIGDATVGDMGLRSARFEIGRYKETIRLDGNSPDRRTTVLSKHPKLLAALTSGADFATMYAVEADVKYSTGFELTGARDQVSRLAKGCPTKP
ncbi:hypothetical protein ATY81_19185 [Rhizobium sp. R72]|uniref:hypothetical protein n=1 Tax=unclassified Rhizobium TaxID=2613769 RepID=UPI000B5371DE|nr:MULTISPECIES: hypothetical protein [unclassified Rhizobium]OWW03242.1 hypothetical protein ATY81_19185 [Rhizobium sp. R72]OWW03434.1 hypothetical protein ATY80_19185 [Rhizobium sp. R711]